MNVAAEPTKIQRRTLAKGLVWAVPAVAVASAAPAYAISGNPPSVTVLNACKQPGASCKPEFTKGYTFTVRLTNPTALTVYIYTPATGAYSPYFQYISGVIFDFDSARYYTPGVPPAPDSLGASVGTVITLLPGETKYIAVEGGATGNSANTSASGVLWFAWGHKTAAGTDLDHSYTPSPWPVAPATTTTPPYGEGWTGGSFSIADFPPCDKKNNCIPTSTPTTTTTTVPPTAAPAAAQADGTVTDGPATDAPATDAPATDAPVADAPVVTDASVAAAGGLS